MTERPKDTGTVQLDGRFTIPGNVRKAVKIYGVKAFVEAEAYSENKILLTVLTRWEPLKNKGPGRDVVKKEME